MYVYIYIYIYIYIYLGIQEEILSFCICSYTIPWSRKWQPTPVFLPGKFQGQRSVAGYNPWGHKELGMMSDQAHTR